MNQKQANEFAAEWIEAWNAHDIDRILSHYTDDFEMNSPLIAIRRTRPLLRTWALFSGRSGRF